MSEQVAGDEKARVRQGLRLLAAEIRHTAEEGVADLAILSKLINKNNELYSNVSRNHPHHKFLLNRLKIFERIPDPPLCVALWIQIYFKYCKISFIVVVTHSLQPKIRKHIRLAQVMLPNLPHTVARFLPQSRERIGIWARMWIQGLF